MVIGQLQLSGSAISVTDGLAFKDMAFGYAAPMSCVQRLVTSLSLFLSVCSFPLISATVLKHVALVWKLFFQDCT